MTKKRIPYGFKAIPSVLCPGKERLVANKEERQINKFINACHTYYCQVSYLNKLMFKISKRRNPIIVLVHGKEVKEIPKFLSKKQILYLLEEYNVLNRGEKWTISSLRRDYSNKEYDIDKDDDEEQERIL